ncbi:MAG: RNA polymerase sigma factor RpoD/SigA [Spirochaetia bacterium]|nr:RNA polymerase sigma factor RpoD/SigA [Spirochaetia bacterium]
MNNALAKKDRRLAGEDDNLLSLYLKDINRVSLLTRSEEESLAREAVRGNTAAKERLIRANLRFVVNVAKKYQHKGLPLEDLISEGNIGLMRAIDRFDVDKGYHFISYAVWWVRQAILSALSEKSRTIRLPTNRALELSKIQKTEGEKTSATGSAANLLLVGREPLSLDAPSGPDDDSAPFGETVEDKAAPRQDDLAIESCLREEINAVLGSLARKESEIIQYRFGLNGRRPLSLRELGARFRLTKERIRQIEKKAIRQLQSSSRSGMLRAYMDFPADLPV